jgi:hypothetical protein
MTSGERATQIWPVLALAARNRQILTYDLLSQLIGVPRYGLGQLLEPIQSYCLVNQLPPLSILVVKTDTGMPGTGFTAAQDIPSHQAQVFARDWLALGCPTPNDFDAAVRQRPSNGIPEASTGQA